MTTFSSVPIAMYGDEDVVSMYADQAFLATTLVVGASHGLAVFKTDAVPLVLSATAVVPITFSTRRFSEGMVYCAVNLTWGVGLG
jgi:hypothetical protein